MTLTRLAFFKWLAAVGIGQAVTSHQVCNVQHGVAVCQDDDPNWKPPPIKCDPNEERCPLGHCQKPRDVLVQQMLEVETACWVMNGKVSTERCTVPRGAGPLEQHICSVCGIVYVPQQPKEK